MRYGLKAVFYYYFGKMNKNIGRKRDFWTKTLGVDSQEENKEQQTSLRYLLLEVQSPQQQEVSPPCGYRIRIRSYTRKQDCHGRLPAFLSLSRKLAGDLFLFLCLNRICGSLRLFWSLSGIEVKKIHCLVTPLILLIQS